MEFKNLIKNKKCTLIYSFALFSLSTLFLWGCTKQPTISTESEIVSEVSSELPPPEPAFWEDAPLVDGFTNLHQMTPDFLSDFTLDESDLRVLGDKLVFSQMDWFSENEDEFANAHITFSLFDYQKGIIETTTELTVHAPVIEYTESHIFVFDYSQYKLHLFDESLSLVGEFDFMGADQMLSTRFFEKNGIIYANNYNTSELVSLSFENNTITWDPVKTTLFNPSVQASTSDGTLFCLKGTDPSTLKTGLYLTDAGGNVQAQLTTDSVSEYCAMSDSHFIHKLSYDTDTWALGDFTGNLSYFSYDEAPNCRFTSSNKFYLGSTKALDENFDMLPDQTVSYHLYQTDGTMLSGFDLKLDQSATVSNGAFLEDAVVFLICENEQYSLYIWDTTAESSGEALSLSPKQFVDNIVTDWGEYEKCNNYATTLEKKYNIDIFLGEEVPTQISDYTIVPAESPESVRKTLEELDRILGLYPQNFLEQLCYDSILGIRFYLGGTLVPIEEGRNNASAYVCDYENYITMVIDSSEYDFIEYTIHHELSHMIDRRLEFRSGCVDSALFSEEKWSELNPEDFSYTYTYVEYWSNESYNDYSEYFYDIYSTTFPTEDRAVLFGNCAQHGTAGDDYMESFFEDFPLIKAKMEYYAKCIRDGFDTTGWPEVLPWEGGL